MPDLPPLHVAVVAQDDAVRESLVLLLEAAGCIAHPYGSGAGFLAARGWRRADCLVLDQEIADIPALDLLARLRRCGADVRVALFTGVDAAALAPRTAELGVARILEVPLMAPGLMDFVSSSRDDLRSRGTAAPRLAGEAT